MAKLKTAVTKLDAVVARVSAMPTSWFGFVRKSDVLKLVADIVGPRGSSE